MGSGLEDVAMEESVNEAYVAQRATVCKSTVAKSCFSI